MLETLLAKHCAPALAGIKPSNIAACSKKDVPNIHKKIKSLNEQLNKNDIYIDILCECERRVLLIAYRKSILEKHLNTSLNRAFLEQYGYADAHKLSDYVNILKKRLSQGGFPHEIGVFLGYPLHDIYCFINHRDEGCLLTGEWKVYHNAEEAKKLFSRFKACRAALSKKINDGKTLAQVFCQAA